MIPVHTDSRHCTTFVTEHGMFYYLRMPMGEQTSMNAYNFRFYKVIENVENLKRCVHDSLIHAKTLEEAFFRTAEYLLLMEHDGIPHNLDKF